MRPDSDARLVLLPPIGLDAAGWRWLALPDVPAIAVEYPGHGQRADRSAWPTLPDLADEVAALHPGPLHLVGVSMGAMIAQHVAVRHPARVHSLLLACTKARTDSAALHERARQAELSGMAGVLDSTLRRWFTAPALARRPAHPGVGYARDTLLALPPAAFASAWRAIAEHDLRARLAGITAPTTCLAARQDASSRIEDLAQIAAAVPTGRLEIVDGPHLVHLERPQVFSAALREHLDWARAA